MELNQLIQTWFSKWEQGAYYDLPITENFTHSSPFGTIAGKENYIRLVEANKEKFLGYTFHIHDQLFAHNKACVRYTATQVAFTLDVSEWYHIKDGLIDAIHAYYHIGKISAGRALD